MSDTEKIIHLNFIRKDDLSDYVSRSGEKAHIACAVMVKNEEKFIVNTLKSCLGVVDSYFIYDTGSTDSTIQKISDFAEETQSRVNIIQGEFVDFSESRNVLLKFVYSFKIVDFILLLDTNDILKNGHLLREEAEKNLDISQNPCDAWMTRQEWWSGELNTYFNLRFIRSNCGWFYKDPIHEYIIKSGDVEYKTGKLNSSITIYQDRTIDDDKTSKRFYRDYDIFKGLLSGPDFTERHVFYMAQTCACLGRYEEAYKYYLQRANMTGGFIEERFDAFLKCGRIMFNNLKKPRDAIPHLMSALEIFHRAEPLVILAAIYKDLSQWKIALMYAQEACECDFPRNCMLFVDKKVYNYDRYHMLGIVAYYAGKYEIGYMAAKHAYQTNFNKIIDGRNMKFYIEKISAKRLLELDSMQNFFKTDDIPSDTLSRTGASSIGGTPPQSGSSPLQHSSCTDSPTVATSDSGTVNLSGEPIRKLTKQQFYNANTASIIESFPKINASKLNRLLRVRWKLYQRQHN